MIAAKDLVTPTGAPTPLEQFRTDAKATDTGAWIGGWETSCTQDTKLAKWLAFEVVETDFPWVFVKRDPKRVFAALELLGFRGGNYVVWEARPSQSMYSH